MYQPRLYNKVAYSLSTPMYGKCRLLIKHTQIKSVYDVIYDIYPTYSAQKVSNLIIQPWYQLTKITVDVDSPFMARNGYHVYNRHSRFQFFLVPKPNPINMKSNSKSGVKSNSKQKNKLFPLTFFKVLTLLLIRIIALNIFTMLFPSFYVRCFLEKIND